MHMQRKTGLFAYKFEKLFFKYVWQHTVTNISKHGVVVEEFEFH